MLVSERRAVESSLCGADLLKSPRARSKSNGGSDAMFLRTRPGARQRNLPSDAFHSLSLEHVRGNTRNNRFRRQVVIQFGGAMVLKDRLARTLAPPKCKLYRRPSAGSVLICFRWVRRCRGARRCRSTAATKQGHCPRQRYLTRLWRLR